MRELFHWHDDINGMLDVETTDDGSLLIYVGTKGPQDTESWQHCKFNLEKDNLKSIVRLAAVLNTWVANNSGETK